MKKILILHNKYKNIGGEDIAVYNEVNFLKKFYNVETLYFENQIKNFFFEFFSLLFSNNRKSINILNDKIEEFKPDVVYVHNTWFKASLGTFRIIQEHKIETIIKLHNFRYFCTSHLLSKNHLSENNFCFACGYKPKRKRLFNKYFEDSLLKSFFVLIYGRKYLNILKKSNMKILVLTKFHKEFINKIPEFKSKIYVFPNYLEFNPDVNNDKQNYVFYGGRISKEKGINELINAFQRAKLKNIILKIAGDGPLLNELKEKYEHFDNVEFIGLKSNQDVLKIMKNSLAVISATRIYEGQPTLLCEASVLGVPSIFPTTGGISEFFPSDYKLSFNQYDYDDLINKLQLISDKNLMKKIGNENKDFIVSFLNELRLKEKFGDILND